MFHVLVVISVTVSVPLADLSLENHVSFGYPVKLKKNSVRFFRDLCFKNGR